MRRIRIEKVKGRPRWLEVPPFDPRDVDVLRAKARGRARQERDNQAQMICPARSRRAPAR